MENDVKNNPEYINGNFFIYQSAQGAGRYAPHFSDGAFFEKARRYGRQAGVAVIYAGLLLFYLLKKPDLPWKVRLTIAGALGYFILPFDVLPDFIVGLGFSDDLSVLMGVLACCYVHVDDGVRERARAKVKEWFGEHCDGTGVVDGILGARSAA
jgi:uncharacterized membrane protein YkvA (DUF1232 family)